MELTARELEIVSIFFHSESNWRKGCHIYETINSRHIKVLAFNLKYLSAKIASSTFHEQMRPHLKAVDFCCSWTTFCCYLATADRADEVAPNLRCVTFTSVKRKLLSLTKLFLLFHRECELECSSVKIYPNWDFEGNPERIVKVTRQDVRL